MSLSRVLYTLALAFSIVGLVCIETSYAQTSQKAASTPSSKESRQRAFQLLDKVISQIPNLRSGENRLLLKLMAADLLWEEDEKRARSLYEEVSSDFSSYVVEQSSRRSSHNDSRSQIAQTRQNIIESMAKHDLRLALEFSRSYGSLDSENGGNADTQKIYTRDLELSLALQMVRKDTKQASDIALQSLDKGVSYALGDFILELAKKDTEAAAAFVKVVEAKLNQEGFGSPESVAMALSLIRMGGTDTLPEGELVRSPSQTTRPVVTHQTVQNLLARLISKALSSSNDDLDFLSALQSVSTEIKKFSPEYYSLLQKKFSKLNININGSTPALNEYQQLIQEGSVGDLLNAIPRAQANTRDLLYQQAAWKALSEGDVDRARQIATDFIQNVSMRDQILSQAEGYSLQRLANQGKSSELRRVLAGLKTDEERVCVLVQCANALAERNNKESALQLLNEAQGLIRNPVKNAAQLDAQIQLAHAFVRIAPDQSFMLMVEIIDQINRLVKAAAVLDGFINPKEAFVDDEMLLRPDSGVVNAIFFRCATELAELARIDLDRAQDLAIRLENPETSLAASMLLTQNLISTLSQRNTKPETGEGLR